MRLNHVLVPCLDVARSVAFYQGLGLTLIVIDGSSHGTARYARLVFPEGDGTLSLEQGPASAAGLVAYFECDDLDEKIAALRAAGYDIASGPETKPWLWREAILIDPDGHRLCLFQAGSYRRDPPWRLPVAGATADPGDRVAARVEPFAEPVIGSLESLESFESFEPLEPLEPSIEPFLAARNHGYVDAAIPSARDEQIDAYLEGLMSLGADARDHAASVLGPAYTATFLAYGERMASLAARERSERHARLGVLAVALTWRACADVRPAIPLLGLLYDAAKRAGADPERLFSEAAALCPADIAPVLEDFLTRADLDQIATEMGFSEGGDRNGFRYRRTWGAGRVEPDDS